MAASGKVPPQTRKALESRERGVASYVKVIEIVEEEIRALDKKEGSPPVNSQEQGHTSSSLSPVPDSTSPENNGSKPQSEDNITPPSVNEGEELQSEDEMIPAANQLQSEDMMDPSNFSVTPSENLYQ